MLFISMQNNLNDCDLISIEKVILAEWEKSNFEKEAFTSIAYDALSLIKIENIDDFLFNYYNPEKESFPIHHLRGGFTDYPFCLIKNDRFMISLFVWVKNNTSIHDHYFSGAFKILQGKSLNKEYSFKKEKEIEPWLFEGKLTCVNSTELEKGDSQKIELREKFIHSVIHTETPTVTVLIRDIRSSKEFHDYVAPNYSWHDKNPEAKTVTITSIVERLYRDDSETQRKECYQTLTTEFDNISDHELFLTFFFYKDDLNNIYFVEDFMLYLSNKFNWFNDFNSALKKHNKDI